MKLTPIKSDDITLPHELLSFISGAKLFDSSCSPNAKVIFSDKDCGYFIKSAPSGTLAREVIMTKYFHSKGLAAEVCAYLQLEKDWLVTTKVQGEDCISKKHLSQPEKLCDVLATTLRMLHSLDFSDCPVQNHAELYLATAKRNYNSPTFKSEMNPKKCGYDSYDDAFATVKAKGHLLKTDTLLHGDYCLPNIILKDWKLSGFIDLDNSGVGDRHVDIFWAIWTLEYNLNTNKFRQRFIDAYGRELVDEEILKLVAAVEIFG